MTEPSNPVSNSQETIVYHERTKHAPFRYARSLGYLDWANEPNPIRCYDETPLVELPFIEKDQGVPYLRLFERNHNRFIPFSLKSIGTFLELSMGLSAWKSFGESMWALRINPSSGNLHPTETHLIIPFALQDDCEGGVYHYRPYSHALEKRAQLGKQLCDGIKAHFRMDGFFVGLSSIYWRESWKYGERAFRYCHLDVGHAMACLSFSANLSGWKITCLNSLSDNDMEIILGYHKTEWKNSEREKPDILFFVHDARETTVPQDLSQEIIKSFDAVPYNGKPNRLSNEHVDWAIIDRVSYATAKPKTSAATFRYYDNPFYERDLSSITGEEIIRQRRSGQSYDGETAMTKKAFFATLDKTIPRNGCAPFDLELGETFINLIIFVNRVSGLEPGLYCLMRGKNDLNDFKKSCHPSFLWKNVPEAPLSLPLYLLNKGDVSYEATMVSCQQNIAGDGCFSLGMIAKFKENIDHKPYLYRHLHWEAGMIGQILYLDAEIHAIRGTGIGCFFDDTMHELLGLSNNMYQDVYHFTVGKALEDERLSTRAPYHHLERKTPGFSGR
jgi:SagB-type dehydrogenase family enzyme